MPTRPKRTEDPGQVIVPTGFKVTVESPESPESQTARLEIERGDARDRRSKGWFVLVLSGAVALACIGVVLSGRYSSENVARAFTLLTAIVSAGAGYQVGKTGK